MALTPSSLRHGVPTDNSITSEVPKSPIQPTWSPISPTSPQPEFQHTQEHLPPLQHPAAPATESSEDTVVPEPLSLDENADAIALRNAISILQIQRQQSIRDIQSLERLRHAALNDPLGFLAELKDNKLSQPARAGVDVDDEDSEDEDGEAKVTHQGRFEPVPSAQNIVRCPPINWDKYHVIGESLDRLHEQQRRYPGLTEDQIQRSGHPPKHEIAARYRPGIDKLDEKVMNAQGRTS